MALLARVIRQPLSDAVVVERIVAAVMEQKLPPGAKLAESPLCEAFDCSRTQIRRILVVLAERGMVTLQMNRGAFVSSPKADEARDVFDARRAVERTIVFSAAARAGRRAFDQLRVSVHAGAAAEARGDRRESIRFSGEFHNRLAQIAANAVLAKFLEQLVARTSLIIGLYGSRNVGSCSESDHATLIDALAERNGSRAAELMDLHLRRIEEALDVGEVVAAHVDLLRVFAN